MVSARFHFMRSISCRGFVLVNLGVWYPAQGCDIFRMRKRQRLEANRVGRDGALRKVGGKFSLGDVVIPRRGRLGCLLGVMIFTVWGMVSSAWRGKCRTYVVMALHDRDIRSFRVRPRVQGAHHDRGGVDRVFTHRSAAVLCCATGACVRAPHRRWCRYCCVRRGYTPLSCVFLRQRRVSVRAIVPHRTPKCSTAEAGYTALLLC